MSAERRLPGWVRHSGVGLELAGVLAGFTLIGYWIDSRYATEPWGVIAGVVLGMVGGLYNLVKQSLQAAREARVDDQHRGADAALEEDASQPGRRGE
jgi:F0F1-type ATP synthase assembly protein I